MNFQSLSIRTKLLGLVAGVALARGLRSSGLYSYWSSKRLLETRSSSAAATSRPTWPTTASYGVLTEDKHASSPSSWRACPGGGGAARSRDVVGALIRDAKGAVLAQVGVGSARAAARAPQSVAQRARRVTDRGEQIYLFRAPVTTAAGSGMAAELRPSIPTRPATSGAEGRRGGGHQQEGLNSASSARTCWATVLVGLASSPAAPSWAA